MRAGRSSTLSIHQHRPQRKRQIAPTRQHYFRNELRRHDAGDRRGGPARGGAALGRDKERIDARRGDRRYSLMSVIEPAARAVTSRIRMAVESPLVRMRLLRTVAVRWALGSRLSLLPK